MLMLSPDYNWSDNSACDDIWIMDNGGTERLTLAVRRTCAAAADHLNMKAHPGMSRAAKYKFWAQVGKYELA